MLARFLALLATWIVLSNEAGVILANLSDQSTAMILPVLNNSIECTDLGCFRTGISVNNSDDNYRVAQQIFYVNGPLQFGGRNGRISSPGVREDYTITPGVGIHKLHVRKVTWNQARNLCVREGGHLAVINTLREERQLINMMENLMEVAFIGVHDLFEEGDWTTVLDEPLETTGYAKWTTFYGAVEPDNYGSFQHCGVLHKSGGMDDTSCDNLYGFFCELPYPPLASL